MQGNILLGNRTNLFVEHVTKSQNQPDCFKNGKKLHLHGQNHRQCKKILEFGVLFWPNFLKQAVTEIKSGTSPSKIFRVPRGYLRLSIIDTVSRPSSQLMYCF